MFMQNKILYNFNNSSTIGIISSYPTKDREIAAANAVSRYTYLLANSISKDNKVVIFNERKPGKKYISHDNVLVVPTYRFNSSLFFNDVYSKVLRFSKIKDYLVQFEFSIYGGKKVIPSFLLTLFLLKLLGKNTTITLHQVIANLDELSGHLGLSKNSFKSHVLSFFIKLFYASCGLLANKIIVHDNLLKERLSKYVNSEKIDVIPHAVGDENTKKITKVMSEKARKEFGFKKGDKVVAVYGYRSWYKGTDWIVRAVKEINELNPKSNLKLLTAGGVSPTLKSTRSYKNFDKRLKTAIKEANGSVKTTGFIPEKDVWKVFAASDVIAFPYRTRMSASGAFSLTLAYKKPFIVSDHFATGSDVKLSGNVFKMNTYSFEKTLNNVSKAKNQGIEVERSWKNIAAMYVNSVESDKIEWNENFAKNFSFLKA